MLNKSELSAFIRDMLDRAENMTIVDKSLDGEKVKAKEIEAAADYANRLSRLGDRLSRVGEPFGPLITDFSQADIEFMEKELAEFRQRQK